MAELAQISNWKILLLLFDGKGPGKEKNYWKIKNQDIMVKMYFGAYLNGALFWKFSPLVRYSLVLKKQVFAVVEKKQVAMLVFWEWQNILPFLVAEKFNRIE